MRLSGKNEGRGKCALFLWRTLARKKWEEKILPLELGKISLKSWTWTCPWSLPHLLPLFCKITTTYSNVITTCSSCITMYSNCKCPQTPFPPGFLEFFPSLSFYRLNFSHKKKNTVMSFSCAIQHRLLRWH